mgnify:CR=1 FL=1
MDWRSRYRDRYVTAADAAKVVRNGDRVVFAMASPWMTCVAMAKALSARAGELRDVSVDTSFTLAPYFGLYETAEAWTTTTIFAYNDIEVGKLNALDPQVGMVPMNPSFKGQLSGRTFRDEFTKRYTAPDVCIVMVTPPNRAGFVSFGFNLWNSRVQMRGATTVIAEVNPDLPIVPGGDNWMPADAFDYFVDTEPLVLPQLLTETPPEEVGPTEVCGYYTSELVNDGDCVMFGGGAMPFRLGAYLEERNDLGCHTELVVPIDLVRKGVINGSRRTIATGKVSATGLVPQNAEEREWLDGNPLFELRDMSVNNDPKYIAQNDNMVAVNAPLEITIWGEINVERVGPRYFRGVGGQMEFIIGALLARNGRSIHSVLSKKRTAAGEWVSTIVGEFTPPGVATVPRQLADIVVTEHGVAHLQGKTERERADALIAIADPDFQPELRRAAKKAFGLDPKVIM